MQHDEHLVWWASFRHALNSREPLDFLRSRCSCERKCLSESLHRSPCKNAAGDPPQDSLLAGVCVDDVSSMLHSQNWKTNNNQTKISGWKSGAIHIEDIAKFLVIMCCKQKHMIAAVELICYILPLPAAPPPPLTWTIQRICCCFCTRMNWEFPTVLFKCER